MNFRKMSEFSSDEAENTPTKYRKQRFYSSWLSDETLLGFLEPVKDDVFKSKCKACGKILNCGKSDLNKHANTKMHNKNLLKTKTKTIF